MKGRWETYVIEARGVGVGDVDDVDETLSRGDDEARRLFWKQIDKGRAIGKGDRREGPHVAEVVDLDEGIGEIVTASGQGERERVREEGTDLGLEPMVKKKLPDAWRSWTPLACARTAVLPSSLRSAVRGSCVRT